MKLLEDIISRILLKESVSVSDVEEAIDKHKRVIINYHSKGEDNNTGARVIEVYAYGLTKAGNPVIRSFQPYGDTTSRVPSWKFFRLDRISDWKPTQQTFDRSADFYYKNLGEFNPNGDETMSVVYKIATFGEKDNNTEKLSSKPKTKDDIFKTDTENRLDRFKQQVDNPIYLSDIKGDDKFKQEEPQNVGPKTKENIIQGDDEEKPSDDVYRTDTETGLENLKKQLQNPRKIDLSQFDKRTTDNSQEEQQKKLDKLRKTLNNKQNLSLADLSKKMNEPDNEEKPSDDVYRTDTETGLENLKKQLQNPRKIDLSNIPKF